jgi:signal recognition particle receptor subunit beta
MVFFNYALRKLNAKIVYYGPGLCGKTTNLVWIHDHFEGGERGKMISLATEGDRTIFFDLLPLEIGSIRGMEVTLQLYTVPGQVHYNSTRQLVLRGADGVVFVADSQRAMQSSNADSFKNLQENLLLQGISLDGFPHVLQFNKRDLKDLVPVEELNDDLNHYSVPIFEATATEGVGVQETLEGIVKLVMRNLRQRYEGATTGARTPGVEDSQVSIPEAPPTPPPGPAEVPPEAPAEPVAFADAPTTVGEPVVPPEPPPVKPVEPPPPVEPIEAPPPVEPVVPPEQMSADDTAPTGEAPVVEPVIPEDPAKTIDFSQAGGADPFGGLGGGFEDEVDTGVYDADEEPAIDFEELKALDAEPGAAPAPPAPEPPPVAEPPPAPSAFDAVDPVAEVAPPEAPDGVPPAFDLDSTDAGLKTQDAAQAADDGPMGAFDFQAPPPDMDSIPDFELDEPEPEPPPVPEPVPEPEAAPAEFEVEVVEPPAEADGPVSPVPPVAEVVPPAAEAAAPPMVEGRYQDRIEAPSPFAPNPESPGGSPEVLEALGAPAAAVPGVPEAEAPIVEPIPEVPPMEPVAEVVAEEPMVEVVPPEPEAPADLPMDEVLETPADVIDEELFDATPVEPIVVGNDDPWTEEELSGVYDLAEVEKAEQAAAIEVAEPRPVDVTAEDNQIHLRLQGTGAIVESGQVRALDIEVPVPGSWVGNRRVTLQLRLTLTPDTEDGNDGPGSPS